MPRGQLWLILIGRRGKRGILPWRADGRGGSRLAAGQGLCPAFVCTAAPTAQSQGLGVAIGSILIGITEMNSQHSAVTEGFQLSAGSALLVLGFPSPDLGFCAFHLSTVERTFTKSDLDSHLSVIEG